MHHPRFLLTALLLATLPLGCEEHVVATRNPFINPPTLPTAQPPQPDGPIESTGKAIGNTFSAIGDFLFGWMKPSQQVTINNTTYQQVPPSQPQTPNLGTPPRQ